MQFVTWCRSYNELDIWSRSYIESVIWSRSYIELDIWSPSYIELIIWSRSYILLGIIIDILTPHNYPCSHLYVRYSPGDLDISQPSYY
jgi:hypothetical protein